MHSSALAAKIYRFALVALPQKLLGKD